jgi:hypothetical protein
VANGWTRSPGRGSASASSSFDAASDRTSLVVASPGACKFEPGGEAGGSAVPEGLDSELESDRVSVAGAVPVDVPIGSFVVVKESAAASVGSAPEASVELAEGSVAVRPSVVSVGTGACAHVPVVSAAAAEVSVVVAEVAVASGTKAHVLVVSGAAAELSVVVAGVAIVSGVVAAEVSIGFGVVVAEVSIASGAGVPAPAVFAAAADPSAVVAEVSVASGAGARVSVVSAVPELSVVAADVSEVSVGAMTSDDAVAAASLGVESVVIAEPSGAGEGGSSPRAGAVNRDAQSTAANTATVQPTNPRPRLRSKRGGRIPETAAELPSISASSPWLRPLSELRVSHLTSGAQGRDANRRADRNNGRSPLGVAQPQVEIERRATPVARVAGDSRARRRFGRGDDLVRRRPTRRWQLRTFRGLGRRRRRGTSYAQLGSRTDRRALSNEIQVNPSPRNVET